MPLNSSTFASTYESLEKATPHTTEAIAASHFVDAFVKFMQVSMAGDATAVPAALIAPAALNPFKNSVKLAFKANPAGAVLSALDLAITAYITTACLNGLYVSGVSGSATAFTPTTPLKTIATPLFLKTSDNGPAAKKKFGDALKTYLGAGQVAFPGPPPVTKPIV
jgi:hypothetical protein